MAVADVGGVVSGTDDHMPGAATGGGGGAAVVSSSSISSSSISSFVSSVEMEFELPCRHLLTTRLAFVRLPEGFEVGLDLPVYRREVGGLGGVAVGGWVRT